MVDLKQREHKIQDKRKHTPWTEFVLDIMSWYSILFYRNNSLISNFHSNDRIAGVIDKLEYEDYRLGLESKDNHYNSDISFFDNFAILMRKTKFPNLFHLGENENSDYSNTLRNIKNAYLSFNVTNTCQNVLYSFSVKENCNNIVDSFMVRKDCDNIFSSIGVVSSFNIFYAKYIYSCSNIYFSTNMIGCQECLFCDGLQNQSYCINNEQYTKEKYLAKKSEILQNKKQYREYFRHVLQINSTNINSKNVNGQFFIDSEDVDNGYYVYNIKGGRNVVLTGYSVGDEEVYDTFLSGAKNHFYGVVNTGAYSEHVYNSLLATACNHVYYCYHTDGCSYCLGCIGLKNKQFCILNKQYTKEERFEKTNEIFAQMEKDGILGDFFPGSMNPFYFNDTVAYLIDPAEDGAGDSFTKEEVEAEGYLRRDEEIKVDIPEGLDTVKTSDLDQYQGFETAKDGSGAEGRWQIDPEILKKVIVDEKGNSYRIIKMEYDFLMKYGLPLPELHWLERIKLGFKFK